ncbi:Glycine betaine transporter OpuD [Candidatus Syntrophocurvum alkaliphilum]|uniref:Glycine betaine transporter OpuD n=1 Tax=Candidatus Syntrophocurvum alkaliphilum TaxID=2293317 RepID=A0A6I6DDV9_9FIRM|nr:BCCT family transporter [Candidatus Syntrophocurvum alkaliphilum]QGU00672.1 Glycine betaine transporter OpuD [Candidatus Syntrophocurvum alkaliphilum]
MKKDKLGVVFYFSVAVISLFVLWGILLPESLADRTEQILNYIIDTFGWFYLFATFIFVLFVIFLGFGPYGQIKLGKDEDEPEYNFYTWLGMLFSAGMGIGLVFWGVAEPVMHYLTPPEGITPETTEAAEIALRYSFFHWGLHPWAIYAIVALTLAYYRFRKEEAGLISTAFRPLLGDKVNGPIGKAIDSLAVIATVFGVATSLGLGALQISGGFSYLLGTPNIITVQIIIIFIVTILYMISASTGLNRGIRYLSNVNLTVAGVLLLFVLLAGPTLFIIENFTATIGRYLGNFIPMSFRLTPFADGEWIGSWTLFYWAWWIAWAPFVGTFIARVSKGRTIREFVLGVLFVPSTLGALWFATFGGAAFYLEKFQGVAISTAVDNDITSALFITLEQFPFGLVLMVLAILLIITFFVTSADSATFVLGILSTQGVLNPSKRIKYVWGILQSGIAIALLWSGGLEGLQTASIIAALPFAIIMLGMIVSINKELKEELHRQKEKEKRKIKKLERMMEQHLKDKDDGR